MPKTCERWEIIPSQWPNGQDIKRAKSNMDLSRKIGTSAQNKTSTFTSNRNYCLLCCHCNVHHDPMYFSVRTSNVQMNERKTWEKKTTGQAKKRRRKKYMRKGCAFYSCILLFPLDNGSDNNTRSFVMFNIILKLIKLTNACKSQVQWTADKTPKQITVSEIEIHCCNRH